MEIPPSAMMIPPRMKSGTARMGVEFAPENALFNNWAMEPPFPIVMIGANAPKIIDSAIGNERTIATMKTTKSNNAAISCRLLLRFCPLQLLLRLQPLFALLQSTSFR